MTSLDHAPPHDVDAERIVLGAMLLDAGTIATITEHITAGDCYHPAHTRLFDHIVAAHRDGEPTEPVALADRLHAAGDLDRIGGAPYLHTLIASVPTIANAGFYAGIVAERAQQRRLGELALRLTQISQAANPIHRHDQVTAIIAELSGTTSPTQGTGRRAAITWADTIEPKPVQWAWAPEEGGRIPAGSLSTAAGREGTGKSSFGLWLTARITTGTLPGAFHRRPRRVLYVAVEDSWEHTLVPRMMAAGADLSMVGRFAVATSEADDITLSLPVDNTLFEHAITDHDVALVVVDPLMSVISERVDTHRERDVRTALDPLARIADRTGAVILGIAHFSKGASADAASLITGSGAFKNVPRTIFGFAKDDTGDIGERVMTQVKNSLGLCEELPSYGYVIESATVDTPSGPAVTGRFRFTGETDRSVHDVLRDGRGGTDPEERAERADAASWLTTYLADNGGEAEAADVLRAGERIGFTKDVLKRAKTKARVTSRKNGMDAGWMWVITP